MISALEALIVYLETFTNLTALVGDRIAPRHRYKEKWTVGESGLVVRYDGGLNRRYTPEYSGRIEFNCYGKTVADAEKVYHELVAVQRAFQDSNRAQAVLDGPKTALIYLFDLISSPTMLHDADVEMPYLMVFAELQVAETAIA